MNTDRFDIEARAAAGAIAQPTAVPDKKGAEPKPENRVSRQH